MMAILKVQFYGEVFDFEIINKDDLGLEGILILNQDNRVKFEFLCEKEDALEEENGPWYLDENGERLAPDELFVASPWSLSLPDGSIVKLLSRFQDAENGEIKFNFQECYSGELFTWLRKKNA